MPKPFRITIEHQRELDETREHMQASGDVGGVLCSLTLTPDGSWLLRGKWVQEKEFLGVARTMSAPVIWKDVPP